MARAFRVKTFPEVLKGMLARVLRTLGDDTDTNDLAVIVTLLEAAALQDADQWDQIARILDLFSLDDTRGDDLDERVREMGSDFLKALRRRPAQTSIVQVTVGDGATLTKTALLDAIAQGSVAFNVVAGTGAAFPTAGYLWLERGTARQEQIVYTRVGDTFAVVVKPGDPPGTLYNHTGLGEVLLLATRSYLAVAAGVGVTSLTMTAGTGAGWPTPGTVIIDRGTLSEEKITYTRVGDVLTLGAQTLRPHAVGATLIKSTAGTDRRAESESVCYVEETEGSKRVSFRLKAAVTLYDGDLMSALVLAESELPGADTRIGANTLVNWSSPPFQGATITNPLAATRGSEREKDGDWIERVKAFIQSLSRATPLAITTLVTGLIDPITAQVVAFAEIVEPVLPGASNLYITDGTQTFALTRVAFLGRDILINDAVVGDRRAKLNQYAPFSKQAQPVNQRTPRIFKSALTGTATLVGGNFLEDGTKAMVANANAGRWLKTDDGQFYQIVSNTAIRFVLSASGAVPSQGVYAVFDFAADPLIPGVDYQFNESVGSLELTAPLADHDSLVAASDNAAAGVGAYTYTTGLGATVQRAVNGDPAFFDVYPGFRASGTMILVLAPTVIVPSFVIQVVAATGFSDADLRPLVKQVIQAYVNSLGINSKIILSKIIQLVCEINGVADAIILTPTANVATGNGRLPRVADANITVL